MNIPRLPRVIAFDLDGTIAESKGATDPEMAELIRALVEKATVAIMSGGAFPQFEKQLLGNLPKDFPLERLYLFPVSASQCWVFENGSWHTTYDHSFSPIETESVRQAMIKAMRESNYPVSKKPWGEVIEDRGAQISVSALGQQAPLLEKELWKQQHDEERKKIVAILAEALPNYSVKMGGLTTIDVTHKGIDKAFGLEQLVKMTGVPIEEMLYIGDALYEGGNDAVVKTTGVRTEQVADPEETKTVIKEILGRV